MAAAAKSSLVRVIGIGGSPFRDTRAWCLIPHVRKLRVAACSFWGGWPVSGTMLVLCATHSSGYVPVWYTSPFIWTYTRRQPFQCGHTPSMCGHLHNRKGPTLDSPNAYSLTALCSITVAMVTPFLTPFAHCTFLRMLCWTNRIHRAWPVITTPNDAFQLIRNLCHCNVQ